MSKVDKFLGESLLEKGTAILLLLFGTVMFVMTVLHWRFRLFDGSLINILQ